MVAVCTILGLLFAVAAPAMIFLGASRQATQVNSETPGGEEMTEEILNQLMESVELNTESPLEETTETPE